MPLTAEIKVNGRSVTFLYAHNAGPDRDCSIWDAYNYEYRTVDLENGEFQTGSVLHCRSDGINKLVAKILYKVK